MMEMMPSSWMMMPGQAYIEQSVHSAHFGVIVVSGTAATNAVVVMRNAG